ncbi:type IV toxin-antitoxin system AbiEi family antitoxin domain-containing protein [Cellulosimicrobium cellulans]|uniref:type IV toxin-antitoxin system AbiEi family antitoxin domain-containing protein n=1 Tax=Cellulosimicrobium cellulans TaxID=1710 RepID=UPI00214A0608|nr:type IV toxin-antitoxin system AbiEi family antitoxin domain-containing protein [Cellulosimicrobium cellulans]
MAGQHARATIAEIAADQWGLVTTAQAAAAGVSKMLLVRMTSAGELERITHGVYATPAASSDRLVETRALWLALDPARLAHERLTELPTAGVLSHASAAALHGIGDLLDDHVEVTLPRRHRSRRPELRTHRATLEPVDVTRVEGLPVTTAARTIADLAAAGNDRDHVGTVLREAITHGLATPEDVSAALDRRLGDDGPATLSELVIAAGLDPESLERAVASTDTGRRLAWIATTNVLDEIAKIGDVGNAIKNLIGPDLTNRTTPADIATISSWWRDLALAPRVDLGLTKVVESVTPRGYSTDRNEPMSALEWARSAIPTDAVGKWFTSPDTAQAWSTARVASSTPAISDEKEDDDA